MLNHGTVGDVLEGRLARLAALGLSCGGIDKGLENGLLNNMLAAGSYQNFGKWR